MEFAEGLYSIQIPFTFPDHVFPSSDVIVNVTKVMCTINSGTDLPVEMGNNLAESLQVHLVLELHWNQRHRSS